MPLEPLSFLQQSCSHCEVDHVLAVHVTSLCFRCIQGQISSSLSLSLDGYISGIKAINYIIISFFASLSFYILSIIYCDKVFISHFKQFSKFLNLFFTSLSWFDVYLPSLE